MGLNFEHREISFEGGASFMFQEQDATVVGACEGL